MEVQGNHLTWMRMGMKKRRKGITRENSAANKTYGGGG
jgi:hypothetical protein